MTSFFDNNALQYLNAINILAKAKIGALQKIYDHFKGDVEAAWHSDLSAFLPRDNPVPYHHLQKTLDVSKEFSKLQHAGIDIVTTYDNNYPQLLGQIHQPPFLLYTRGMHTLWTRPCIGVVGTRKVSEYGKQATPFLVEGLVRAGFTIVSGLAAGIDTLAHTTALQEQGTTIGVLGCGVDDPTIYPAQNQSLARRMIQQNGLITSEYPAGVHGTQFTFPQRNRIISGLSYGTLVIEAGEKSGALITAHAALEQNRDVFAVPGTIFSKNSIGTHSLLSKGAKLVTRVEDILEEYPSLTQPALPLQSETEDIADPVERVILHIIADTPTYIDDIIQNSKMQSEQVTATLMIMEINKKIRNLGNNTFIAL